MSKLLILEKKHQNTSGSASDKLGLGPYFIYEYTKSINNPKIVVEYAFCLSNYLKSEYLSNTKKYEILRQYNFDNNIKVFFGEDSDYHQKLHDLNSRKAWNIKIDLKKIQSCNNIIL